LDFRQLEAFVTVVSTGSMTAAAGVLGTSQPTVTRLVQELENTLGIKLLNRHGPRINPTREGLDFYTEAERLLAAVTRLETHARDIANAATRSFDIAAISAVGLSVVARALARLEPGKLPDSVRLTIQTAEGVPLMVTNGQADIGFSNPPLDHPGLEIVGTYCAPCVAAVAESDPLARKKVLAIGDFRDRRLASLGDRGRFRRLVYDALGRHRIGVTKEITCSSTISALHVIQSGLAIGIVEPLTAYGVPLQGVAIRTLDEDILFSWSVIVPQGHPQRDTLKDLVRAHEEIVAETVPGYRRLDQADLRNLAKSNRV
jgi:DNA-binding transcriptional LysR family regulator